MKRNSFHTAITVGVLASALTACSADAAKQAVSSDTAAVQDVSSDNTSAVQETSSQTASQETAAKNTASEKIVTTASTTSSGMINASDLFTDRDLTQTADYSEAKYYTLQDGEDLTITDGGVYVLTGKAAEVTVYVDVEDSEKVQIVLDGVTITNSDFPCIYVNSADKVFITTTDSENTLTVTGSFTSDGNTNTDAVIFAKDDLVLNGTGTLNVTSSDNGITAKDDLKITGGTYVIQAVADAIEVNDMLAIADGNITIVTYKDGIHAEDSDDTSVGSVYICGGTLQIAAADDAVHATRIIQIDDGTLKLQGAEGLEATYIQVNGGDLSISASDDGINAARKSSAYTPTFEMNDGSLTVSMGSGDTDGIDSNGNIVINGGTINITGQSSFDYDGQAVYNGGTIIVNGQQVNSIPNQMMGGGMMGGMQGGMQGGMHGGFGRR
ncbi:MAG: carbohydrate-binding domain-containing protein [Solobacterium sp.]|nr:carbohydrate-binding domain-containing protein [Solobacterium sp.]